MILLLRIKIFYINWNNFFLNLWIFFFQHKADCNNNVANSNNQTACNSNQGSANPHSGNNNSQPSTNNHNNNNKGSRRFTARYFNSKERQAYQRNLANVNTNNNNSTNNNTNNGANTGPTGGQIKTIISSNAKNVTPNNTKYNNTSNNQNANNNNNHHVNNQQQQYNDHTTHPTPLMAYDPMNGNVMSEQGMHVS